MNKVAVVMGSKSDLPVVEKAINVLKDYHIQTEVRVLSAHRCPNEAREFAASAREGGFSVIIAAAGMAAHLAGAMAANTTLPVIGIPCRRRQAGRNGCPAGHRSDAQRNSSGHGGHRWGEERRPAGDPDPGGVRPGAGPPSWTRPGQRKGRRSGSKMRNYRRELQ